MGNCKSCLDEQWKTGTAFTKTGKSNKINKIVKSLKDMSPNCTKVNILMIGNMSSGKSSFVNTLKTAMKKDCTLIDTSAGVHGSYHQSVTSQLHKVILHRENNGNMIQIFDCRGFPRRCDENSAFVKDLQKAIMGNIKENYKFDEHEIDENNQFFRKHPTILDRMHGVFFVMKATDFQQQRTDFVIMTKMKEFLDDHHVPHRIVLTRVDCVKPCLSHPHLKYVYWNKDAKSKAEAAGKELDLGTHCISPVANYTSRHTEPTITQDVLALEALDNILQQALSFITDLLY